MMVEQGDADAFLSGLTYDYGSVIRPALEVVGVREGVRRACGAYILLAQEIPGSSIKARPYFLTDATVNIDPSAEDLAEAAILVAELARQLRRRAADRDALVLELRQRPAPAVREDAAGGRDRPRSAGPDLAVDGEMQADTAVVAEIVEQRYPFSQVSEANVLVCPSLEAANISYKLLERIGGAEVIGPVLLGMGKSVHVLQAGDEVQKIVRMAAMAVMDAQIARRRQPRRHARPVSSITSYVANRRRARPLPERRRRA